MMASMSWAQETLQANADGNEFTANEKTALLQIFEQEKLARDVYAELGEKFGINLLKNISISKQKQMSVLMDLMVLNQMSPIFEDARGVYNDQELSELYTNITAEGSLSLNNAFRACAKVEDKNIFDLEKAISETTKNKLITLYSKISCNAGNDLRAGIKMLVGNGEMFMPDYISVKLLRSIMHDNYEFCGNTM